jgi:hypothetical protein
MSRLALLALAALLAGCGGRDGGDWRTAFGRPTANERAATTLPPLAVPATLDLPAPRPPA